jgi:hypothetical protein
MDRRRLLVFATLGLVLFTSAYWIWSNWGLITVHADSQPLAEVIRSIEKQGGIHLRTNMAADLPVTMHVDKVPLTEALETLSAVTDSRWRLAYLFADTESAIEGAVSEITKGTRRPEGWKSFDLPNFGGDDAAIPPDPRRDVWEVKPPEEKTLQGWLRAAAIGVSASFSCPEVFNPAVSTDLSSGEIRKRAPSLAKAAGAKVEEVFLLLGRREDVADGPPSDEDGADRPRREGMGSMMRERRLAEIAKLPPAQREAAQKEMDEFASLRDSLKDLSPDQRRAKFEEFFQNSDRQEKMEDRRMQREERQTPEQRHKRYQKYVDRKRAAQSAGN